MTLPPTFWSKTARTDCIVWTGAQNSRGYGCFAVGGVSQLAHRLAWEDVHGPIPDGLVIDHLCRVHACVNVEHMDLVSRGENTRRAPRVLRVGGECAAGHPIVSDLDLYPRKGGRSECRACRRAYGAKWRERALAAAAS